MKVRIKRTFKYMDGVKEKTLKQGIYDLDERLAGLALRWGKAELVVEKKAPENKLGKVSENKSKVVKKPRVRRSTGTEPDE